MSKIDVEVPTYAVSGGPPENTLKFLKITNNIGSLRARSMNRLEMID